MKKLMLSLAIAMLFAWAAPVQAAEGDIPREQLADLGLASMQVLPEEAGMNIRGKGFVIPINLGYLPRLYLPFLIIPTEGVILNTPFGSFRFLLPFRF